MVACFKHNIPAQSKNYDMKLKEYLKYFAQIDKITCDTLLVLRSKLTNE